MGGTRSGPLKYAGLGAVLFGILSVPLLYVRGLQWVAPFLSRRVLESVCFGFLCLVTLVFLGFLLVLPTFWVVAELYDRGYLPDGW